MIIFSVIGYALIVAFLMIGVVVSCLIGFETHWMFGWASMAVFIVCSYKGFIRNESN